MGWGNTVQRLAEKLDISRVARVFFEPQLIALGLSNEQIEIQTREELEQSLESVNEAIQHPSSFGTLRLTMDAQSGWVIARSTDDSNVEQVTILPLLLQRKKLIVDRLRRLRDEEQIESLQNLAQETSEENIRKDYQRQIEDLKAEIQQKEQEQEEAKASEQAKHQEELQVNLAITKLRAQAEIDMKKAKARSEVWQSFLARESIASIVGGFLLILMAIMLLIAMFFKLPASDIINNSFLVILGYFFGQATSSALPHPKVQEGGSGHEESTSNKS